MSNSVIIKLLIYNMVQEYNDSPLLVIKYINGTSNHILEIYDWIGGASGEFSETLQQLYVRTPMCVCVCVCVCVLEATDISGFFGKKEE